MEAVLEVERTHYFILSFQKSSWEKTEPVKNALKLDLSLGFSPAQQALGYFELFQKLGFLSLESGSDLLHF